MTTRNLDINSIILRLLKKKERINIHDIAKTAHVSVHNPAHRRAIQRAVRVLVENKTIKAEGNARARTYVKASSGTLEGIPVTERASDLLAYITKPLHMRSPAGYNQDFLSSYEPNRDSFLTDKQKSELNSIGSSEGRIQPAGTYARNILDRMLVDISWNSSRLEGNTYSLLETKRLIEIGEASEGKSATESQMILNHKSAIEYIIDAAADESITSHTICSIHALLSENLLGDPAASGRLRQAPVSIGGSTYLPLDNPHVLRECFEIITNKLNLINDPFEQAIFSLIHLSYIQAFEDVNKRTARLVANIPLVKRNLKPLSFVDVSRKSYADALLGVYEKNDTSLFCDLFVWAYGRSSQKYSAFQQSLGEPNLLKMKFRNQIHEIIRTMILQRVEGRNVVTRIREMMNTAGFPQTGSQEYDELFQTIETEISSLHDGNIARFRIRPNEFRAWKELQ
ncbi:MAG: hypothetical protein A2583_15840 [Bdellovibrionales bacterium RIFOXYD1_FULL_53_11]|nr:MAG: hypothetical protein A2583_15840 [Bdellovibrionales bacterium RIFOXYD1_FULL_53_11]